MKNSLHLLDISFVLDLRTVALGSEKQNAVLVSSGIFMKLATTLSFGTKDVFRFFYICLLPLPSGALILVPLPSMQHEKVNGYLTFLFM